MGGCNILRGRGGRREKEESDNDGDLDRIGQQSLNQVTERVVSVPDWKIAIKRPIARLSPTLKCQSLASAHADYHEQEISRLLLPLHQSGLVADACSKDIAPPRV